MFISAADTTTPRHSSLAPRRLIGRTRPAAAAHSQCADLAAPPPVSSAAGARCGQTILALVGSALSNLLAMRIRHEDPGDAATPLCVAHPEPECPKAVPGDVRAASPQRQRALIQAAVWPMLRRPEPSAAMLLAHCRREERHR